MHSHFLCDLASFKLSDLGIRHPSCILFCSTAIRRDMHSACCPSVVNCPVAALSVFYSTVSMRSLYFLQLWTALT